MFWNVFYHLYLLHIEEAERTSQGSISRLNNNVSLYIFRSLIDEAQLRCIEIISGKKCDSIPWISDYIRG